MTAAAPRRSKKQQLDARSARFQAGRSPPSPSFLSPPSVMPNGLSSLCMSCAVTDLTATSAQQGDPAYLSAQRRSAGITKLRSEITHSAPRE